MLSKASWFPPSLEFKSFEFLSVCVFLKRKCRDSLRCSLESKTLGILHHCFLISEFWTQLSLHEHLPTGLHSFLSATALQSQGVCCMHMGTHPPTPKHSYNRDMNVMYTIQEESKKGQIRKLIHQLPRGPPIVWECPLHILKGFKQYIWKKSVKP